MKPSALFASALATCALARADSPLPVPFSGHNYRFKITVSAAALQDSYGEKAAPDGKKFLVLKTTVEDVIDPALAKERELPTRAVLDDLHEAATLVVNHEVVGAEVSPSNTANLDATDRDVVGDAGGATHAAYIRPVVGLKDSNGHRAFAFFDLPDIGAKVTNDLIFAVPPPPWKHAEFIFRDPTGGNFQLTLTGKSEPNASSATAGAPEKVISNEVLAFGATILPSSVTRDNLPTNHRLISVDLVGKSLIKVKDAMPPYDPTHEKDAEFLRPDPASWAEFKDSVQLVVDGSLICAVEPGSSTSDPAEFAPDTWTHHHLDFVVPENYRALDLVCLFPSYTIPGIDDPVQPAPAHLHLFGPNANAAKPPTSAEKKVVDDQLVFFAARHATAKTFAGQTASDDEKFLILDVVLQNLRKEVAEFTPSNQLVWFNEGTETPPDEISAQGPLAPARYFHLAPGDCATFQAVWRVPAKLAKGAMGYKGNEVAERYSLDLTP